VSVGRVFSMILAALVVILLGWAFLRGSVRLSAIPAGSTLTMQYTAMLVRAALIVFFEFLVVIVAIAGLVTFSLAASPRMLARSGDTFSAAMRPLLYTIVAMGIVNGLWFGLIAPRVESRLAQYAHRKHVAEVALQEAERLMELGMYSGAEEHLELYSSLEGESERSIDLLREAREGRTAREQEFRNQLQRVPDTPVTRAVEVEQMTVIDLIRIAREYLEDGDYFSAHHFATLAVEQSRTPRRDARIIQAEAFNAIERGSLARDEGEARELYAAKIAAYEAYQRGATIPEKAVEAYYRFQELEKRIPTDPDVQRFTPLALERVREISVFVEDARNNHVLPGRSNLVFLNERHADWYELVSVDKLVRVRDGDFLYGIEVIRVAPGSDRSPFLHLRAPYGKVISGYGHGALDQVILRAVSRDGSAVERGAAVVRPEFFAGDGAELEGGLTLRHTVDEIARLGGGTRALSLLSLGELIYLPAQLERLGQPVYFARVELLTRLFRIIGFFVLSIGSIAVGWRFRSRYPGRPPGGVFLIMPVVPWLAWRVIEVGRFTFATIAGNLVTLTSLTTTFVLVTISMFLLVIFTVFSLLRQKLS
jgi:hypothetical protein